MTKASNSGNVYLVEHYSPGLTVDGLGSWAARVRDTAVAMGSEGRAVRYLRSTIVPADEALLCVFEADSEELVRDVYARAGVPFERLSAAIADESEWLDSGPPLGAGGVQGTARRPTQRELRASGIARRRTEEEGAEALFPLRATTTAADSRCSRRRSAGGADGTTLFRSVCSDEDGGDPANIAASGASNQTPRDARAAQKKEKP